MQYDAVVIGGGPAGLQAALMLGRACRKVLVCDVGDPRNAPARHTHGFLTRDGTAPLELLRLARADVAAYPTVSVEHVEVVGASAIAEGFALTLQDGRIVTARGVILAAGVRDVLPSTPGFRELWGTGVFSCPYCHGYELRGQPLAVYGQDMYATHMVYVIKAWTSDVVLVTDGPCTLDDEALSKLYRNGIAVHALPIKALEGDGDGLRHIIFADGTRIARRGLLFKAPTEPRSNIGTLLGASFTPEGLPVYVDPANQTTVPRLYIVGDMGTAMPLLLGAATSGAMAGAGLSNGLAMFDAG